MGAPLLKLQRAIGQVGRAAGRGRRGSRGERKKKGKSKAAEIRNLKTPF